VFAKAKTQPVRVIYAEGRTSALRATQVVLEEKWRDRSWSDALRVECSSGSASIKAGQD
jgi:hypothetical protein